MVGGFCRPRDQDERDGEEECDHHHQRCGHQVRVWWKRRPGGTRVGREEGAGGQCCWALQRRRFACKQRDMTTSALQLSALHPIVPICIVSRDQGPPQVCLVFCQPQSKNSKDKIALLHLKPSRVKIIIKSSICLKKQVHSFSFCHTVLNTVQQLGAMVLCERLKANKAFRRSGCKTKKNRAAAKATGRQRFTVFGNIAVGINNASSMSGHMMAELKPTVLRWGKCKRDGWVSKPCSLLSSAYRFFSNWNTFWGSSRGEGEEKKGFWDLKTKEVRVSKRRVTMARKLGTRLSSLNETTYINKQVMHITMSANRAKFISQQWL